MKHFGSICKHEVFWDLKHKQCMHYTVNDNLLRNVNDARVCFDYNFIKVGI